MSYWENVAFPIQLAVPLTLKQLGTFSNYVISVSNSSVKVSYETGQLQNILIQHCGKVVKHRVNHSADYAYIDINRPQQVCEYWA